MNASRAAMIDYIRKYGLFIPRKPGSAVYAHDLRLDHLPLSHPQKLVLAKGMQEPKVSEIFSRQMRSILGHWAEAVPGAAASAPVFVGMDQGRLVLCGVHVPEIDWLQHSPTEQLARHYHMLRNFEALAARITLNLRRLAKKLLEAEMTGVKKENRWAKRFKAPKISKGFTKNVPKAPRLGKRKRF